MAQNNIFYKIVDAHFKSCSVGYSNADKYEVQYQLGNFVQSKTGTPLFVFQSLDAAQAFSQNKYGVSPAKHVSTHIYECEVINPRRIKQLVGNLSNYTFESFWQLRKRRKSVKLINSVRPAPKGTWICDSVKLLRKVA